MPKFLPSIGKTTPEEARIGFWVILMLFPSVMIWASYPDFWNDDCLLLSFVFWLGMVFGQQHMYGFPETHAAGYNPPLVYGKEEE